MDDCSHNVETTKIGRNKYQICGKKFTKLGITILYLERSFIAIIKDIEKYRIKLPDSQLIAF